MHDTRTKHQRAAAAMRLGSDGGAMRLEELAKLLGVSAAAMVRWACIGKKRGGARVYLDAVRVTGGDWFASWKAVERWRAATGKGERARELVSRVASSAIVLRLQAASEEHR